MRVAFCATPDTQTLAGGLERFLNLVILKSTSEV
ncbi:hypothetical protein JOF53_003192 [Crossiella equi]|uniref:Uncharacterized protein n=1 Tax=Crossiella equi TaxID=130796 RepID=A0ABS5ACL4_9PSEU|nr:hypothetical protein [Crossiella equi]